MWSSRTLWLALCQWIGRTRSWALWRYETILYSAYRERWVSRRRSSGRWKLCRTRGWKFWVSRTWGLAISGVFSNLLLTYHVRFFFDYIFHLRRSSFARNAEFRLVTSPSILFLTNLQAGSGWTRTMLTMSNLVFLTRDYNCTVFFTIH